jgi:hypothetical protein
MGDGEGGGPGDRGPPPSAVIRLVAVACQYRVAYQYQLLACQKFHAPHGLP